MLLPNILNDEAFKRKLANLKGSGLDSVLDELQESIDKSYLQQCEQQPDGEMLKTLNIARISSKHLLEKLKSSNLELTEE